MIGFLEGKVRVTRDNYALISAGGIGYKVFATKDTLTGLIAGEQVALWTHLAVREDALDLYGFPLEEELRLFELLLTVSGIGPRSALAILDLASVETLHNAISQGKAAYLTTVSGIGKKTAEKIVLELRDKIGAIQTATTMDADAEAIEALRSLGYSLHEARETLRSVSPEVSGTNDRLREALKIAGRK